MSSSCFFFFHTQYRLKKKSARSFKNKIKKTQKGKTNCVIDCLTYLFHHFIQGKEGSDSATSRFTIFRTIGWIVGNIWIKLPIITVIN